ncbi:MAG: ABC transporter permease subunit, partial [Angelakisella sp.]
RGLIIFLYICMNVPFTLFFLLTFFKNLSDTFEEAAAIDGCSPMKTFWVIMLPLVQPGIITVTIFNFITIWNEYFMFLIESRLLESIFLLNVLRHNLYLRCFQNSSSI